MNRAGGVVATWAVWWRRGRCGGDVGDGVGDVGDGVGDVGGVVAMWATVWATV